MFLASGSLNRLLVILLGVVFGLFSGECPFNDRFSASVDSFFLFLKKKRKNRKKESTPAENLSQKVQSPLFKPKTTLAKIITTLWRQPEAKNMIELSRLNDLKRYKSLGETNSF